jgi:hypothetical protein
MGYNSNRKRRNHEVVRLLNLRGIMMLAAITNEMTPILAEGGIYIGGGILTVIIIVLVILFLLRR